MSDSVFGEATGLDERCMSLSTERHHSTFPVAQASPKGSQICLPPPCPGCSHHLSLVGFAQGMNQGQVHAHKAPALWPQGQARLQEHCGGVTGFGS